MSVAHLPQARRDVLSSRLAQIASGVERLGWLSVFVGAPMGNTTVALLVLAVGTVLRLAAGRPLNWGLPRGDAFYSWAWAFQAVTVLSALFSPRPLLGLAVSLGFFLMFFILARGAADLVRMSPKQLDAALYVAMASGTVAAAYALYTYFGLDRARAVGVSVTENGLGTFSAFMVLFAAAGAARWWGRRRAGAALAVVTAALNAAALVVSYSRGAWLSFAASAALFAWLLTLGGGPRTRRAVLVAVLCLAAAGSVLVASQPRIQKRLFSAFQLEANKDRLAIWQATYEMIKDHLLLGVGGGAFPREYGAYRTDGKTVTISFAHNIILQTAAEFGLLGVIALSGLIGVILRRGWRAARNSSVLVKALYAGFVGILLHDMVDNVTYGMNGGGLFWLVGGLLVHLSAQLEQAKAR